MSFQNQLFNAFTRRCSRRLAIIAVTLLVAGVARLWHGAEDTPKEEVVSFPPVATASAPTIKVNVVSNICAKVADGDTLTLGNGMKIRFYGIDAPESSQPYGKEAGDYLRSMVLGQRIDVEVMDKDRYGRFIGKVYRDGMDINAEMLKAGLAWHYKSYDRGSTFRTYSALESEARAKRVGLWQQSYPEPPWDYRKRNRKK